MTLAQVPLIYNIDRLCIYVDNTLKVEQWVGAQSIGWYAKECKHLKEFADRKIDSMTIFVEGRYDDVVVLEIYFK